MECLQKILCRIHVTELSALRTMVAVFHKQIWNLKSVDWHPNVSEELKIAAIECINLCFQRSTSELLLQYYTSECRGILGHLLLSLVDVIEKDKYKQLWYVFNTSKKFFNSLTLQLVNSSILEF